MHEIEHICPIEYPPPPTVYGSRMWVVGCREILFFSQTPVLTAVCFGVSGRKFFLEVKQSSSAPVGRTLEGESAEQCTYYTGSACCAGHRCAATVSEAKPVQTGVGAGRKVSLRSERPVRAAPGGTEPSLVCEFPPPP